MRKRAKESQPWDPRRTLAGLEALVLVLLIGSVILGWRSLQQGLVRYAEARPRPGVVVDRIVLEDMPAWMSPMLQVQLREVVAAQASPNPMDYQSLERGAWALSGNPWVERVERLQRLADGGIRVRATFREPVAMVEGGDGFRMVDIYGVQLPGVYLLGEAQRIALPIIMGVGTRPPGEGQAWSSEELQAGLDMIQTLGSEPYFAEIKAFDVGERDEAGRIRISLRTGRGLVRWGLPPGREQAVEPDVATKKTALLQVYRAKRSIDAGGQIVSVHTGIAYATPLNGQEPNLSMGYSFER